MTNAIATTNHDAAAVMEQVIAAGDLKSLSPEQRVNYYMQTCNSLGLNPMTKPFDYITLNGKLTLYATKGATDQIRSIRGVSLVGKPDIQFQGDYVIVSVEMRDATGRTDADVSVLSLKGLQGEQYSNAIMKAVTKAKRRCTLSIAGLGMLDESEVETIPSARPEPQYTAEVIRATGEFVTEDGEIVADGEPMATDRQIRMIFGKGREIGWTDDEIKQQLLERYGAGSSAELTKAQATEFIDYLVS